MIQFIFNTIPSLIGLTIFDFAALISIIIALFVLAENHLALAIASGIAFGVSIVIYFFVGRN